MIGILFTFACTSAWVATRCWPWVGNLIILMLLGLGMAFAELNLLSLLGLTCAVLLCSVIGLRRPMHHASDLPHNATASRMSRPQILGLVAVVSLVALCVGLNTQRFLQAVKGNNASYGGYEAYK